MYQRVLIMRGRLCIGALDFPLTPAPGAPDAPALYRGEAWVESTRIVLGDPMRDAHLYEYSVGTATPESVDYDAGLTFGAAQRAQRWPNGKGEHFVAGWTQAWAEKGKPVDGFVRRADGQIVKER
jgi:hypothetical protein